MTDYRIEKLRRAVRVVLTDGRQLDGEIFVQALARFHTGPEEPIDLLNDDDSFFALSQGESVSLVAKDRVLWIETPAPDVDNPYEMPHLGVNITLAFTDGRSVSGYVFPETRAERPRLLDFLNGYTQRFLAVFAADKVCLVNRREIACAEQVD